MSKNVTFTATLTITGTCQFCTRPLTKIFPDDFPDMFKMCCFCLSWAELILGKGKEHIYDYHIDGVFSLTKMLKERLDAIEKIITLVGK